MRLSVSTASSGDNTLVTPPSGFRVRLLGYNLVAAGTVTITWKSGSTALTGAMTMSAGVPHTIMPGDVMDPLPLMETGDATALILTLSGAVQVSGWIHYEMVA